VLPKKQLRVGQRQEEGAQCVLHGGCVKGASPGGRGRQRGQGSAARAGALQELMPQALQEAHLRAVSRRWWGMVPWDGGVNGRLGSKDWNEDCCHGICLLM